MAFLEKPRLVKAGLTAQGVLEEMSRLAFTDIRAFFDERGNVKPITEWTEEMGSLAGTLLDRRRSLGLAPRQAPRLAGGLRRRRQYPCV